MIDIFDVLVIPATFILMGLLTIPVVRIIRTKTRNRVPLLIGWLLLVFIICFFFIVRLAFKYFNIEPIVPFVNIDLSGSRLIIFSSSFLVDALSIYIMIIFIGIGVVVALHTALTVRDEEQTSERYYSLMIIIPG